MSSLIRSFPRDRLDASLGARFMEKVVTSGECWTWTSTIWRSGYGGFTIGSTAFAAHRVSYEIHVGPIPDGLQIDHLCRNKLCVNPNHLEPVTASVNKARDYESRGTCRNGLHPRTEESTKLTTNGKRLCRECSRARTRRYMQRARLLDDCRDDYGSAPPPPLSADAAIVEQNGDQLTLQVVAA